MKLTTPLVALALAIAGSAASAATVGTLYIVGPAGTAVGQDDNPEIGPIVYSAFESDGPKNVTPTFDYVYNFQLDATSDLKVTGSTFEGSTVSAAGADFNLYTGTSTGASGTAAQLVGGTFSFAGTTVQNTTFSGLTSGDYFFEVKGSIASPIGTSYNVTIQAPDAVGVLTVPEPTNVALLLAGLGLMGFMAKRRARD